MPPAVKDAGLAVFFLAAVAAAYLGTPDSPGMAMAAVLAMSTAAAMHTRLAMGRLRAIGLGAASVALLLSLGARPGLVAAVLVSALAGAELVARCTRRSEVLRAGSWTGLLAGLGSLSGLAAPVPPPAEVSMWSAFGAASGGVLGATLVLTAGPILERLFGHTTRLTMSEWLSYEHPLLRQLASTAPGTFQHSVNVGLLAHAAAGAVQADSLTARLAGLYHDVGKMRAPDYFYENQRGANPHDELQPWESARILRAHVHDGVQLVGDHHMGERIADAVREHHGTGTMRLLKEKADALSAGAPPDERYQYPGPRPRSRETAIVMIADQLEATARSAPPVDEAACDAVIQRTLDRIRGEGQLEDSGLGEADIQVMQPALSRALHAMYHRRMTYPPAGTSDQKPRRFSLVPRVFTRRRAG